jgi:acetyltransferase EpsM
MKVIICGAGGQGRVVLDILRAAGKYELAGFVDSSSERAGKTVAGLPVLGPANVLPKLRKQKIGHAIVAIGDTRVRLRYAQLLKEQGFELVSAIHPTAWVSPTATIGSNVVIAPHASVCTDSKIDSSVILNTNCVVDHECEIAEGVHVCPGVNLGGRVRVGRGAWVGIGASVIQCLSIGEFAVIGAGSAVIRDVPARATAVGVPAKVIKVSEPQADPAIQ